MINYTEEILIKEASNNLEFIRPSIQVSEELNSFFKDYNFDFKLDELKELMLFNSLITISKLDLAIIAKNLKKTNIKWEAIYFMKNAHLTIHETIVAYNSYNKFLCELVQKSESLKERFHSINSALKTFKTDYKISTESKVIRNKMAGHIDKDFKLYYDQLSNLNKLENLKMIDHFIQINLKFLDLNSILISYKN